MSVFVLVLFGLPEVGSACGAAKRLCPVVKTLRPWGGLLVFRCDRSPLISPPWPQPPPPHSPSHSLAHTAFRAVGLSAAGGQGPSPTLTCHIVVASPRLRPSVKLF